MSLWRTIRVLLAALATAGATWAAEPQEPGPRLLHVPAANRTSEQGVLTPVPVSLEVPRDLPARRVLLHYRLFGEREWRALELRREALRYVGAIPCLEVGEMTREVRYYVRVHDAAGAVIAFSGTRSNPYVVSIHHPSARPDLASGARRCPDPAECPPGLPGCPSEEVERIPCKRDRDCEGASSCGWDGFCGADPRRKNWFGLDLSQSAGAFAAQGACSVQSQETAGYACFREGDGAVYAGRPVYSNEPIATGWATARVHLSYERLLFYNTSLSFRVGYSLAGHGPTLPGAAGFVPYSFDVLARYYFGDDPFARPGLRFFATLGLGFGQHDVAARMRVREDPLAQHGQGGNALEHRVRVWKRSGDALVSLGAGVMCPVSESVAAVAEGAVGQAFPYAASILSANAGLRLGFR